VPGGDLAQVVDRALDALITQLERRKFAATKRPRKPRAATSARSVPAHVKRAVWQRDDGRCAFVFARGRRCSARGRLEFDHVDPVARGGTAHAERMRLQCRAHNQFEAERLSGPVFMRRRREEARAGRAARTTRPGTS
jgi:5-methylcytosine-specific restriction endonuclease McrA